MRVRHRMLPVFAAVAGGVISLGYGPSARADEAKPESDAALRLEVRELKAKLDAIEAKEAARDAAYSAQKNPVAPASNQNVSQAVQRDADQRTVAMDIPGMGAGYVLNKGFVIKSDDGNFLLHPWAYFQARYSANYRDNGKASGQSSTDSGFEVARLKFVLDGNVFNPDLTYQFIWNTVKAGGGLTLNDAWTRYHIHNTQFAIEGGQIRDPLDHEQIMFATQTMTVDRSIIDDLFAGGEGIVQGVDVSYGYDNDGCVHARAAFTHGLRNNNVTFQDFPTNVANWGIAGRVDYKLFGSWPDYNRFSAIGTKENLLVLGAGVDYTEAGDTDNLVHVIDAQYDMTNGFAVYGAYLGRYTTNNGGRPGTNGGTVGPAVFPDTYDATARVMVSYLYTQHLEPFIRYEYIQFDGRELAPGTRHSALHDIGLGANYYFYGQRAKLTGNLLYLPNGSPVSDTAVNDILGGTNTGNELIFQLQFQLII
jgi:hypothetical protein